MAVWGSQTYWGTGSYWGERVLDPDGNDVCDAALSAMPDFFREDPFWTAWVCQVARRLTRQQKSVCEFLDTFNLDDGNTFQLDYMAEAVQLKLRGLTNAEKAYDIRTQALCNNYDGSLGQMLAILGRYKAAGSNITYSQIPPRGYRLNMQPAFNIRDRLLYFWTCLDDGRPRELVLSDAADAFIIDNAAPPPTITDPGIIADSTTIDQPGDGRIGDYVS